MRRILLLIDHKENRRLLQDYLGQQDLVVLSGEAALEETFDLCLVDGVALDRQWEAIRARRRREAVFLPFLLVTARPDVGLATRHLWQTVDELIISPIEKVELQARVESLLRARRQALELAAARARVEEVNAELETFASTAAHDLRTPLRALAGISQILCDDYRDRLDAQGQEYLHHIITAASDMDTLIRDLLAYSRVGRAELTLGPVDLALALGQARQQLADEIKQRGAQVTIAEPLPVVNGHLAMLAQVLANLLGNAIKFVAPGIQPQVRLWPEKRGQVVRLWIEDNGIGIEPRHQERVFKIFERLHGSNTYPGSGVGLAIVRKAMTRMGGRVGLESQPGQGSRFWIELPQAQLAEPKAGLAAAVSQEAI